MMIQKQNGSNNSNGATTTTTTTTTNGGRGGRGAGRSSNSSWFRRRAHVFHRIFTGLLLAYVVIQRDVRESSSMIQLRGSSLSLSSEMEMEMEMAAEIEEEEEREEEDPPPPLPEEREEQRRRRRRLGDGCYHVFLDVGANVGVHGRFLLEPDKYRRSRTSVPLFRREYPGDLDNRDVCVFAFEANPKHWPRLREVSEAYAAVGWRYHVIEAAVSDDSGKTLFYHQGKDDESHNEWGFSGAKDLATIYGETKSEGRYTEDVDTIRLSDWIAHHVHDRSVPESLPSSKSQRGDDDDDDGTPPPPPPPRPILSMKMDIEGYEYVVIPDLIHTGAICGFSFVFGEFHPNFAPITRFRNEEDRGDRRVEDDDAKAAATAAAAENGADGSLFSAYHRISLESQKEMTDFGWALTTVMESSRQCPVRFFHADDESYLHDGQPLPSPPPTSGDDDDDEKKTTTNDDDEE